MMEQIAEKDEELEDLRRNNEAMKSQLTQMGDDVSIFSFF